MEEKDMKFEPNSIKLLKLLETTNKSIYLTGKAGAGKSTIINYFISKTKKKFILLGITGISAINIGGQTIHKFFGLIPGKKTSIKPDLKRAIKEIDLFIIDEVSMMRADLFDKIEEIFRKILDNNLFFGGKQLLFVGDLFQLPPVGEQEFLDKQKTEKNPLYEYYKEKYKGLFFFFGKNFNKNKITTIELQKVYRQTDTTFINMLNRLRLGDNSNDLLKYFNQRVVKESEIIPNTILIATTNSIVNKKNNLEIAKLPGETLLSSAIIKGQYYESEYPTDRYVNYKVGARIMFSVNEQFGLYVNGTLGTITEIRGNNNVVVLIDGRDDEVIIPKKKWTNTIQKQVKMPNGETIITDEEVGSFVQFPFKLAFAITIHKVQGKTFDNVVIDLGWGAFLSGQVYVALSRCTNYKGLQLLKPIKKTDIKSDFNIINNFLNK